MYDLYDTVDVDLVVELNHPMNSTLGESYKEFAEQMNADIENETDFEKFESDDPVSTEKKDAPTILANNFCNQKSEISIQQDENDENSQIVENDEMTFTLESKLNDHTTRIKKKSHNFYRNST